MFTSYILDWTYIVPTLCSATIIIILTYIYTGIFSDQPESPNEKELSINNEEAKIVIDPGKAFCQMVKFKMRFQRKVKRFRERKKEDTTLRNVH